MKIEINFHTNEKLMGNKETKYTSLLTDLDKIKIAVTNTESNDIPCDFIYFWEKYYQTKVNGKLREGYESMNEFKEYKRILKEELWLFSIVDRLNKTYIEKI